MTVAPLRVLITGFGPFPGIVENASQAFAPLFAYRAPELLQGVQTACAILPTQWHDVPRLLRHLLDEMQPHLCLHFGVQGNVRGLVLETIARNKAAERIDAAGLLPPSATLETDAPLVLLPRLGPTRLLTRARQLGLPIAPSVHAGDYLCNALFFHSLSAARRTDQQRLVAFLHLPVRVGGAGRAEDEALNAHDLPLEQALAGASSVLAAMTEHFCSGLTQIGTGLAAAQ
jgi:pyroglutamyl-peptidase